MSAGHPHGPCVRSRPPETPCRSRNLSQRQPKVTAAAPLWFYSSPQGNTPIRIELQYIQISEIAGFHDGTGNQAVPPLRAVLHGFCTWVDKEIPGSVEPQCHRILAMEKSQRPSRYLRRLKP
ncbi:hypothetical protein O988_01547 [Pseudogymnoascus sp. VKM F-3808]|nr:hypothetical protein O988_01547 [Pseudogymnoascus sp. VKM F-3808]